MNPQSLTAEWDELRRMLARTAFDVEEAQQVGWTFHDELFRATGVGRLRRDLPTELSVQTFCRISLSFFIGSVAVSKSTADSAASGQGNPAPWSQLSTRCFLVTASPRRPHAEITVLSALSPHEGWFRTICQTGQK